MNRSLVKEKTWHPYYGGSTYYEFKLVSSDYADYYYNPVMDISDSINSWSVE